MANRNPILEAAASIKYALGERSASLYFCRSWAANNQEQAHKVVNAAARQVDFLRSIGALPAPGTDTATGHSFPAVETTLAFLTRTANDLTACKLNDLVKEYDDAIKLIRGLAGLQPDEAKPD